MPRKIAKNRPGDAANRFVRVLLTDASLLAGGFTDEHWKKTLEWFDGCCAYTGDTLTEDDREMDHAVPMNRHHCGLDLYGNVVPTAAETNRLKSGKHYREFLKNKPATLKRLECFIEHADYRRQSEMFADLRSYCEAQYEMITKLCETNYGYLRSLAGHEVELPEEIPESAFRPRSSILPIEFDPEGPSGAFKEALLSKGWAWITTYFTDGTDETVPWNAANIKPNSNIVGNLRGRPQYRQGEWQRRQISRVRVHIDRSGA